MPWIEPDDEDLPDLWPDSDSVESEDALAVILDAAKDACLAYAPRLEEGAPVPSSWRLAQAMQAANIVNATRAKGDSGQLDGSSYGMTAHPLDWQVKQLLRPRRVLGAIA